MESHRKATVGVEREDRDEDLTTHKDLSPNFDFNARTAMTAAIRHFPPLQHIDQARVDALATETEPIMSTLLTSMTIYESIRNHQMFRLCQEENEISSSLDYDDPSRYASPDLRGLRTPAEYDHHAAVICEGQRFLSKRGLAKVHRSLESWVTSKERTLRKRLPHFCQRRGLRGLWNFAPPKDGETEESATESETSSDSSDSSSSPASGEDRVEFVLNMGP